MRKKILHLFFAATLLVFATAPVAWADDGVNMSSVLEDQCRAMVTSSDSGDPLAGILIARRGCCSHHGGVSGQCSGGRVVCNDGTLSPSCTCRASEHIDGERATRS